MKHALKIAIRNLNKGKRYTLIHIFGITLGITACLLIGTVVIDELSYDRQWSRSADTYRLLSIRKDGGDYSQKGGTVYSGLAPTLKNNFPEVEDYCEASPLPIHLKINKEDPVPVEATVLHADTAVFKLVDIKLIEQDDITPAGDINKIILSESFSKRYFGKQNPLGKRLYDVPNYDAKANEYIVAGIMQDIPSNTHLRADILMLNTRQEQELAKDGMGSGMRYARQYILLRPGTDPQQFEQKINNWYTQFTAVDKGLQFELQPMADIYLKTDFSAYQPVRGNILHSYIFSAVALLLLLIACINYINLSTARASSRQKETGVQKILGASRRHLMLQSLLESLLIFGIAGIIAFISYQLTLPALEQFIGHPLAFNFASNWIYLAYSSGIFLLVCLFSGWYPAWLVSGFRMVGNMQRILSGGKHSQGWLRKSLIVLQFSISVVIIVSMFVVQQQVHFLKSKDVGYDTDGLLSINHVSWDNKSNTLRTELLKNPDILSFSITGWLPADGGPGTAMRTISNPDNPNEKIELWSIDAEADMAQTLGLRLKEGRYLDRDNMGDAVQYNDFEADANLRPALITTSTARILQVKELNQPLPKAGIIPVGIIEDFNSESLHKRTVPTVIVGYHDPAYGALLLRTQPEKEKEVMRYVASVWKELYPDKLFDIQIVKEILAKQYAAEDKLQQLFSVFSLLTMFLATMGIFGLIVHALGLRVKEIGIRKVLGASVMSITTLLSQDFIKLVLTAIVIASPIAYWVMHKWLEDFAYRIEITWWVFVVAGTVAITVAMLTVGYQAMRAARANPVDSLRDE